MQLILLRKAILIMASQMYRAIFFDLDGTLLPMDVDVFMKQYFKVLGVRMGELGVPQDVYMQAMKAGILAMATNDTGEVNSHAFWPVFLGMTSAYVADDVDMTSELNAFYETDFAKIGQHFSLNPAAAEAIQTLKQKGYPLVLATMPMFPRAGVEWRVRWAGVDPAVFDRITTFDNSTSVKPKPNFYAENLAACGLDGRDVLMVGNNTKEDLAAMDLGCDAFLITDHLIDPVNYEIFGVKHGSLQKFASWCAALPECSDPALDIDDGVVSDRSRERVLAAAGIEDGEAGGARTLEEAGRSGGGNSATFQINGVDD